MPTGFSALVRAPTALRPHLPEFCSLLTDLGRIENAALSADACLQAGLMALHDRFREDLPDHLAERLKAQAVDVVVDVLRSVAGTRCCGVSPNASVSFRTPPGLT